MATVLVPADGAVAAIRRNEQNALVGQFFAQRIAVVATIPDQARDGAARLSALRAGDADGVQCVVDERDLRGAGRGNMYSHGNALAVDVGPGVATSKQLTPRGAGVSIEFWELHYRRWRAHAGLWSLFR